MFTIRKAFLHMRQCLRRILVYIFTESRFCRQRQRKIKSKSIQDELRHRFGCVQSQMLQWALILTNNDTIRGCTLRIRCDVMLREYMKSLPCEYE